jgi:hypothetical protein
LAFSERCSAIARPFEWKFARLDLDNVLARLDLRRVGANGQPASEQAVASGAVEPEALVVTHWFDSGEEVNRTRRPSG